MKYWGYGFMTLGVLVLIRAWTMEVSISVDNPLLSERQIINYGLISQREIMVLTGGIFSIIGAIFIAVGEALARLVSVALPTEQPVANNSGEEPTSLADEVPCPECGESIRRQAVACKHCGAELKKT